MLDFLKVVESIAAYVLGKLGLPAALVAVILDLIQIAERAVDKTGSPLDGAAKLAMVVQGASVGADVLGVTVDASSLAAAVSSLVDEANAASRAVAAVRSRVAKSAGVDLLAAKADVDAIKTASAALARQRTVLIG